MRYGVGILLSVGLGISALGLAGCAERPAGDAGIVRVAATTTSDDQAAAFNTCVRENGVADFPGATVVDGTLRLFGEGVDLFDDAYRKAVAACEHHLPEGTEIPGEPDPVTPSLPAVGFTCSGTCPQTPEAPAPPK